MPAGRPPVPPLPARPVSVQRLPRWGVRSWVLLAGTVLFGLAAPVLFLVTVALGLSALTLFWIVLLGRLLLAEAFGASAPPCPGRGKHAPPSGAPPAAD